VAHAHYHRLPPEIDVDAPDEAELHEVRAQLDDVADVRGAGTRVGDREADVVAEARNGRLEGGVVCDRLALGDLEDERPPGRAQERGDDRLIAIVS
jgi:tetrahydromethanopterin S-methyltransferase subunit F